MRRDIIFNELIKLIMRDSLIILLNVAAYMPASQYTEFYFEVTSPSEISYSYRIRPAKNFGVHMVTMCPHSKCIRIFANT